jgi:beta-lactamase class A
VFEKRYYLKQEQKQPSRVFKFIRYVILISILLFTVNVFSNIFIYPTVSRGSLFVSPLAQDIIQKTVSFINSQENSKQLEFIADDSLGKDSSNFGIVIKNLKTGERYYLNEDKIYNTASLYKLWVMAVVIQKLDKGEFKDTDVLSDSISQLNTDFNIASDSADLTNGVISLTVDNALTRMIMFSDNYSAMLLTQKVKLANVTQFLNDNNFNDSKVGTDAQNPKSSARDIASFFDKLYHDKLNDSSSSKRMLDLLKKQQLNGKIPKYISNEVDIAHKTGELGLVSHDAGIVYTKKGDYIIVVMSQTNNPAQANEEIATLSKHVYEYFIK